MRYALVVVFILLARWSAGQSVTFKVDARALESPRQFGIRGSVAPLRWDETLLMTDEDRNGIYEATVAFDEA